MKGSVHMGIWPGSWTEFKIYMVPWLYSFSTEHNENMVRSKDHCNYCHLFPRFMHLNKLSYLYWKLFWLFFPQFSKPVQHNFSSFFFRWGKLNPVSWPTWISIQLSTPTRVSEIMQPGIICFVGSWKISRINWSNLIISFDSSTSTWQTSLYVYAEQWPLVLLWFPQRT